MKTWIDNKNQLKSINNEEKNQIQMAVELVSSIVSRRKELGLSQRDLASRSGVHHIAIAKLEKNGTVPRIDTLCKLIKPLGLVIKLEILGSK